MSLSRIAVTPEHHIRFPISPFGEAEHGTELANDQAVLAELERQGWTVALDLAGRSLLDPAMTEAEWDAALEREGIEKRRRASPTRTISRPIRIAGKTDEHDLPTPRELWGIGQRALQAAPIADRFATTFGRWSVDVRPVIADREKYLGCHTADDPRAGMPRNADQKDQLEIGDALGVAIYVLAHRPKVQ